LPENQENMKKRLPLCGNKRGGLFPASREVVFIFARLQIFEYFCR